MASVKKTVKGFGAVTYKNAAGAFQVGLYGQEIEVDAEDAKRLEAAGAFREGAGLEAPQASDVPIEDEKTPTRKG